MTTNSILSQMPLDLGDNLILRFARPDDVDALADFNARIFNNQVGQWTRDLMSGRHPTVQASDFTVVEDTSTHKIVSSMNLISQTWAYGGIPFQVGRPEIVGTDPAYRRRGLVRKQFEVIHALSATRCQLMQGITGIEWFYRQFGYEMAMNLWGSRCVDATHLPKLKEGETEAYHLRPVVANDYAFIRDVYDHAIRRQPFAALRSPEEWDYEFNGRSKGNDRRREWLIIETAERKRLGYVQYLPWPHWSMLCIYQVELKPGVGYLNLVLSLLRELWAKAQAMFATGDQSSQELHGLELALEQEHPVYRALSKNLVREMRPSAWYIRVPDMVAFLRHIRPALEKHLVGTVAEGYSGELKLNFFRRGIQLKLERGQITDISNWFPEEVWHGDVRFPDLTFLQLVCGRRRFSELTEDFADCWGSDEAAVLLDCLFPPFTGNVWALA